MTKFYIEYNPYTMEYKFEKNGRPINKNSRISEKANQRLQAILEPTEDNWEGLAKEIQKACNDNVIEVTFRGRKIDFDDLRSYLEAYKDADYSLILEETCDDDEVMRRLDALFSEIRESGIEEFNHANADGETIFDVYENMKENVFKINVIATMSSGKSTLINAIIGTDLLPAKNEACTATVASILDKDELKGQGFWAECYKEDWETVVYPGKWINSEDLKKYNEDEQVTYIDIQGDISGIPSDKINLLLQDTPGPNNSLNIEHGELTRQIIADKNAIVLYVMNATQFAVEDDKELLNLIAEQMRKYGKEARDRFIFVVNKCDELDEEKGETVETLLDSVRDYLWDKFRISDPVLIPTSARTALLARKDLNHEFLTRQERMTLYGLKDFVAIPELHYEDYATLTPTVRKKLEDKVNEYHSNEDTWNLEAIIHTGVPAVEETITEFLEKYAYPMKFADAIQDLKRILADINMKASFHALIEQDEQKREEVQEQIEEAKGKQANSEALIVEFSQKLDEFSISSADEKNWTIKVEKECNAISDKYSGRGDIDKAEADILVKEFVEDLQHEEVRCRDELNEFFNKTVYSEGEKMLTQYQKAIESILSDINIPGYEFDKDIEIENIKIKDLQAVESKYSTDRMKEVTKLKKNPKKQGLLGFFKFWQPKMVPYTEYEKDGVNVNLDKVLVDILSPYRYGLDNNIKAMYAGACENLDSYKKFFNKALQTASERIKEIIAQIGEDTSNLAILQDIVVKDKEKATYAEEIISKIDSVMNF